jgi:hypothetical protein
MKKLSVVLPYAGEEQIASLSQSLLSHPLIGQVLWLCQTEPVAAPAGIQIIAAATCFSGAAVGRLLAASQSDYLLVILPGSFVGFGARALERLWQAAEDSGAGIVYSDFRERRKEETADHPLIDYQLGSLRDTFDFGSVMLIARRAAEGALQLHGTIAEDLQWGGLYDLRLKISADAPILRLPEPLYTRAALDLRASGERVFDYVDPRQRAYQIELERIATAHLKRIGAFLAPRFAEVPEPRAEFPVKASVVIPVRNREKTIADAVRSALAQTADFAFNVIVVDNHSTDGTTALLAQLSAENDRLIHLIPARTDLGIGGCWNEAIYAAHCGRYAVQLDSDDLYIDEHTLARIIAKLDEGRYAMVIGSYTTVDFELRELPPGLIDHREWTRENGRNNALRINGLGAPRAFDTATLRRFGLPNVSYGEDYAVALRLSRDYEIGRIYDSLYLCRRWGGNTDSALPLHTMNRYDTYKDRLRTLEILARQQLNAKSKNHGERGESGEVN